MKQVYCGTCTEYRQKTKQKLPGASGTKPFAHCVVDGCGKTVVSRPNCMFQLFV